MKSMFFTVVGFIIKLLRFCLYFVTAILTLGLAVVIFNPNIIHRYGQLTNSSSTSIHIVQVIIVLLAAISIQISIVYFLRMSELLLNNCSKNIIFVDVNLYTLDKMMVSLVVWTGIQFLTFLFLDVLRIGGASEIFNFSLKDYSFNLALIGITYVGKLILQNGISKQEDYDQII